MPALTVYISHRHGVDLELKSAMILTLSHDQSAEDSHSLFKVLDVPPEGENQLGLSSVIKPRVRLCQASYARGHDRLRNGETCTPRDLRQMYVNAGENLCIFRSIK